MFLVSKTRERLFTLVCVPEKPDLKALGGSNECRLDIREIQEPNCELNCELELAMELAFELAIWNASSIASSKCELELAIELAIWRS